MENKFRDIFQTLTSKLRKYVFACHFCLLVKPYPYLERTGEGISTHNWGMTCNFEIRLECFWLKYIMYYVSRETAILESFSVLQQSNIFIWKPSGSKTRWKWSISQFKYNSTPFFLTKVLSLIYLVVRDFWIDWFCPKLEGLPCIEKRVTDALRDAISHKINR